MCCEQDNFTRIVKLDIAQSTANASGECHGFLIILKDRGALELVFSLLFAAYFETCSLKHSRMILIVFSVCINPL